AGAHEDREHAKPNEGPRQPQASNTHPPRTGATSGPLSMALDPPAAAFGYAEPDHRPFERGPGSCLFDPNGTGLEHLACPRPGLLGTSFIDLVGMLGRFGEDDDPVRPDVHEAAEDGKRRLGPTLLDPELA